MLENFRAKQLGPIAYKTGTDRYRKVQGNIEETFRHIASSSLRHPRTYNFTRMKFTSSKITSIEA